MDREGANKQFTNAKKAKNDEFYTQYEDIQKEINAYIEYNPDTFRDKTVLLPCDDPEWSNFTRFFAQNFETLGLKKLISTSYATDSKNAYGSVQLSIFDFLTDFETQSPQYDKSISPKRGKIFTLTRRNKKIDINDLQWKYLNGDGDFRSDEVKALRDEADNIKYASYRLRNDKDVCLAVLYENHNLLTGYEGETILNDYDFMIKIIREYNWENVKFASKDLRNNKDFMRSAIRVSSKAKSYLGDKLLEDESFMEDIERL